MIEKKRDQELYDEVSRRLRVELANNNMKAIELAEKTGLSRSSISQYVNGVHVPNTTAAYKIGQVLGVNPVYLMGFDVKPYSSIEAQKYSFEAPKGEITLSSVDYTVDELKDISVNIEPKTDSSARLTAYALKLYELYDKASPEVQKMVDYLLKTESK